MDERDLEEMAESSVKAAGFDPSETLVDAVRFARRLVGPVRTMPVSTLPGDAVLARVCGERRIYVRGKLPPLRLRWAVLHECAEAILDRAGYREADVERVANRLAASLAVPGKAARKAFRKQAPKEAEEWTQLALQFRTTESCAVLRFGEVTGEPLALVTLTSVRARGAAMPWPSDEEMRKGKLPGIRKTRLREDRTRVVLRPAG